MQYQHFSLINIQEYLEIRFLIYNFLTISEGNEQNLISEMEFGKGIRTF